MTLCNICDSIPFRQIIGHESIPIVPPKDATILKSDHIRCHDSITQLIASARTCELCDIVSKAILDSLWYNNFMEEKHGDLPVWLVISRASFLGMQIYLGKERPEIKVFGKDLEIFASIDEPMAGLMRGPQRFVQESPIHDHALRQLESWLRVCGSEHSQCWQVAKDLKKLPTRVLDLGELPGRQSMIANKSWHSLFQDTQCTLKHNHSQEEGQYIALSYCWGPTLAYKTTRDNLETHIKGIAFPHLPKTLQDAIYLTRYLDLRYVWIDCLCIVQDDKADWERESAAMAEVYSDSYLTITAARARDSSEGFLGLRKTRPMDAVSFSDAAGTFELFFAACDVSAMPGSMETISLEPLKSEPLSKRVWTLQERLLPPRVLHFATDQMYWDCAQLLEGEDNSGWGGEDDFRLDDIIKCLKTTSQNPVDRRLWYQLILEYTSRNMTCQSDKLPALSGVIARIQRATNDAYYAGLWKNHFLEGLLWRLQDPQLDSYVYAPKQPSKPNFWRAPSWSFASVEGVILYQEISPFDDYCAEVEEYSVTPSGANPLGELKAGFVRIWGPVTTLEQVEEALAAPGYHCYVRLRDQSFVKAKVFFDFERYGQCDVLMLSPYAGLAVIPVDPGTVERYVRVGVVQIWKLILDIPDAHLLFPTQFPEPRSIVLL